MGNPVPPELWALLHERGGEEPLARHRRWILLRWFLAGVVILATLVGNWLLHLEIRTVSILLVCALISLLNAFSHYFFFFYKGAVELCKSNAKKKEIELSAALPDEDSLVLGPEDEMEKILNNLITNVIKIRPAVELWHWSSPVLEFR